MYWRDCSSDVCSSDLVLVAGTVRVPNTSPHPPWKPLDPLNPPNFGAFVTRLTAAGDVDPTYGVGGTVVLDRLPYSVRSEERRVGKDCRPPGPPFHSVI